MTPTEAVHDATPPGEVSTRHLFRRLARRQERALRRAYPGRRYRTQRETVGQTLLHGKRWAIVRTR